jgi:hypothetical protein
VCSDHHGIAFGLVTLIFICTTVANIIERPDGVKIAAVSIAAILTMSLASRFARAFELRVTDVTFDQTAQIFIRDCARRIIRFIANEPDSRDRAEYSDKLGQVIRDKGNGIPASKTPAPGHSACPKDSLSAATKESGIQSCYLPVLRPTI